MNEKTKTGLVILEAAMLMGVLGDALLRVTPWGLNVFLWISALATAMIMLTFRRRSEFLNAQTISLHAALIFFAAMFVWRDSVELKILNTMSILTILAILTLPALKIKPNPAGVLHYFYAAAWSVVSTVFFAACFAVWRHKMENRSAKRLDETSDCRFARAGDCRADSDCFRGTFYGGGRSFSRHYRANF